MAKKKPTARQRNIERLAKDYQASVAGLEPEYQSVFEEKTKAISGYEQQSKDFQKRLEDYQKSLAEYKANPLQEKTSGWSFQRSGDNEFLVIDGVSYPLSPVNAYPTEKYSLQFSNETDWWKLYEKKPVPKFEEAPPQVADTSEYDAQLEQLQAKRKTLGEGFEREKAERKSSQLRAVSQRSRERPMLSKGVTL